jgi:hypothetical protein
MKKNISHNIRIYSRELILEYETKTTYLAITETRDFIPEVTYYYEMPERFKMHNMSNEELDIFYPLNPN